MSASSDMLWHSMKDGSNSFLSMRTVARPWIKVTDHAMMHVHRRAGSFSIQKKFGLRESTATCMNFALPIVFSIAG
jgi:hypothetical protein